MLDNEIIEIKLAQFHAQKTTLPNETIKYLANGHLNYDKDSKQYLHRNYSLDCLTKVSIAQQLKILTGTWDFIKG